MEKYCKGTNGGWVKYEGNPVLGGEYGVCFDISILKEDGVYRMWFSWRSDKCIAVTESEDGIHWSKPVKCLLPNPDSGWEDELNRCSVLKRDGKYHMWYTGQVWESHKENGKDVYTGASKIGYATSDDGVTWAKFSPNPVFCPEEPWEKVAVMCPNVLWDEEKKQYLMWYSGGEQYEPDAIGFAVGTDGVHWTRTEQNPVFSSIGDSRWERQKCTACQVFLHDGWYYMFYIGFQDIDYAQIGMARSRNGVADWERSSVNPIIAPDEGAWDGEACYKPYVICEDNRWMLWYNGRRGNVEQIGLATLDAQELPF
jgi:predicted GH43/DUF377 family glycosyl hydrolase